MGLLCVRKLPGTICTVCVNINNAKIKGGHFLTISCESNFNVMSLISLSIV